MQKKPARESDTVENIVAVVVVLAIVAAAWYGFTHLGPEPEVREERFAVGMNDDPVLGNINAPILIVEFSDFMCVHCASFEKETLPFLKEKYIDTGLASFAFRDFPIETIHPGAEQVHEAAGCANDQGKFWEYHDLLFERQEELSPSVLGEIADQLELNRTQFDACRESRKYFDEIAADISDGQRVGGVTGTPTFFINGRKIAGAEPISTFEKIVDEEIASQLS